MRGLKARWWWLRVRWRRIPGRIKLGVLIGVVAVAALTVQHYSGPRPEDSPPAATDTAAPLPSGEFDAGHAHGEFQPEPTDLPPPPDYSQEAARAVTERFATNFGAPNGNFDDWLARISPDVSAELQEQYRLTDIRNVAQATVLSVTGPVNALAPAPAFQVAYSDGSRVEITVEMDIAGWKVSSVVPLDPATPPAPADAAVSVPDQAGGQ